MYFSQTVEVCSTGEATNGGQVGPGEVAPVVTACVQTGNNKIAAYGAAVQRCNGDRRSVLKAIVDGQLYISYWDLTLGHESGMDFVIQNPKKAAQARKNKQAAAALARATQTAALAPAEPQAETPPPTANGIPQGVLAATENMAEDNAEDNVAIGNAKEITGGLANAAKATAGTATPLAAGAATPLAEPGDEHVDSDEHDPTYSLDDLRREARMHMRVNTNLRDDIESWNGLFEAMTDYFDKCLPGATARASCCF